MDLDDLLMVSYSGDDSLLIANTAEDGWTIIATFVGLQCDATRRHDRERDHPRPGADLDFGNGIPVSHDLLV